MKAVWCREFNQPLHIEDVTLAELRNVIILDETLLNIQQAPLGIGF